MNGPVAYYYCYCCVISFYITETVLLLLMDLTFFRTMREKI